MRISDWSSDVCSSDLANQIIERTASAIGIDQILIKIARILHGLRDGFFCDRIKGHAINLWRQSLFFPQHLLHMPANRLAFAIRVRRQNQYRKSTSELQSLMRSSYAVFC